MRIHRLEIQAFGPFAGHEIVDFDALGAQGLFLLNGSTGAGKTSVLDAISYALYGAVPGARHDAIKRLHSHHAAPDVGPEVVCEFTAGGRRLEVTRNPEWMRPSKRGTGLTRENARTALRERVDGTWVALSQRNDEAASEIQRLLGMNMAQFTKVVLLAQGEFAAFLRADAAERQALLEKLFGTEIYKELETRLAENAKEAKEQVATGLAGLLALEQLARSQASGVLATAGLLAASEAQDLAADTADTAGTADTAAGENAEAELTAAELGLESTGGELFEWLVEQLSLAVAKAGAAQKDVAREAEEAAAALAAATEMRRRHAARALALAEQERLDALEEDATTWAEQARLHHKAEVLAGGVKTARAARENFVRADARAREVAADFADNELAAGLVDVAGLDVAEELPALSGLESVEKVLAGQAATVAQAMPDELRLLDVAAQLLHGEDTLAESVERIESLTKAETDGLAEIHGLKTNLGVLRGQAVPVEQARQHHAKATAQHQAVKDFTAQQLVVKELRDEERDARDAFLDAKADWLAAVELRLSLAAGEIAATLVDGEPCKVCGSTVHPAPSELAGSGVDAVRVEKSAKDAHAAAEKTAKKAADALAAAQQQLAILVERGGDSEAGETGAAVELAKDALDSAIADAAELSQLAVAQEKCEAALARTQASLTKIRGTVASLTAANAALATEKGLLEAGLFAARAGFATLGERADAVATAVSATAQTAAALRARETALHTQEAAVAALQEALEKSDFSNELDVLAALLAETEAAAVATRLAGHAEARTLLTAQLALPEVLTATTEAANGQAAPTKEELLGLESALADQKAAAEQAALELSVARDAKTKIAASQLAYAEQEEAVAPLREHAKVVAGVADALRGGGDNQLKMTLTSYVLAARLEQVAQAASLRLSTMSGDRYTLTHTDAKAGGNKKSGLGLAVVDGWTQLSRDTSTLSGGESFMASLSLALGLADVVQQESGGLDIETLFVDEGFGSLDEESLDQVMDALEGLRDGGRMVGLVSHVGELKTRIPVHLHVKKGRHGSTLSIGSSL